MKHNGLHLVCRRIRAIKVSKLLGGAKKVKELLKILEKHNTNLDDLINYLKSVDYKVPSQLELRVEELEKRISALESGKPPPPVQKVEITLRKSAVEYKLINIPKKFRPLFPGYKIPFTLETNIGEIETYITGGYATDKKGDPNAGEYFTKGLSKWFDQNRVKEGDTVIVEIVEPNKRYRLYKKTTTAT